MFDWFYDMKSVHLFLFEINIDIEMLCETILLKHVCRIEILDIKIDLKCFKCYTTFECHMFEYHYKTVTHSHGKWGGYFNTSYIV